LEEAVQALIAQGITPVLCVDEFNVLATNREFDVSFFAGLRAIANMGLCLVIASEKPMVELLHDNMHTSSFSNIFLQIVLKPFTQEEAEAFIHSQAREAGLTTEEEEWLLMHGAQETPSGHQWLPARLQLAGKVLLEEKLRAKRDGIHQDIPDTPDSWRQLAERLEEYSRG
jgi:hypothetical protein